MAPAPPRPLTPEERAQLGRILAARSRQAWLMTGLSALLTAAFLLRLFVRTTSRNATSMYAIGAAVLLAIGAVVYFLGFGLVRKLRADLAEGEAEIVEGKVTFVSRDKNAYGDVVTTVDIDKTRVLTREPFFDAVKEGDEIRALVAPRSRVALALLPLSLLVALVALVASGCAFGYLPSPITPGMPEPAASGEARAPFLPIARLRWTRGAEQAVLLTERGEIVADSTFIGTLRPDGTFTTCDKSRSLVMDPDGTVHVGPGWDVVIDLEGTATTRVHGQPDETLTLDQVAQPRGGRPGLTLEGGTTAYRRTAMWILMIPDLLRIAPD